MSCWSLGNFDVVDAADILDSGFDTIVHRRCKETLGVTRTDDIVMIQITLSQRTQAVKVALYKAIAEGLAKNPGVRPGNVLISLVPVAPEDWSFGDGKAQYLKANPP